MNTIAKNVSPALFRSMPVVGKFAPLSASEMDRSIKTISSVGKLLDNTVQALCLSIHAHIIEHGDHTRATKLVNALPMSSRRQLLIRWFEAYTWLSWDQKSKKFDKDVQKNMAVLDDTTAIWYETLPEESYKPFSPESSIKSLKAKLTADENKGVLDLEKLVAFAADVEMLCFERQVSTLANEREMALSAKLADAKTTIAQLQAALDAAHKPAKPAKTKKAA